MSTTDPTAALADNPRAKTRAAYHHDLCASAREAFAHHVIVPDARVDSPRFGASRWRLARPRADRPDAFSSIYWAEIVALAGGVLLVHGDIEHVLFSHFSPGEGRATDFDLVAWMGAHEEPDGYVAQKARIGMGNALIDRRDDDVALGDLRAEAHAIRAEWAEDHAVDADGADGDEPAGPAPKPDAETQARLDRIADACRMLRDESVETVARELWDEGEYDTEWLASLGRVTDARVYFAHAAVRRLWQLLTIERAATEPAPAPPVSATP